MDTYRKARVYVRDIFAGIIEETDMGYEFAYDAEYMESPEALNVSLTMPMREEPYTSRTLFSFFDGLIPEGWLLNVVAHNWKIDRNDRFGILMVACHDPIGNVSIRSFDEMTREVSDVDFEKAGERA